MRTILLVLASIAAASCAPGTDDVHVPEPMPIRAYPESALTQHPDSALRAELLAMGEEDQAVRQGLSPETFQDTAFMRRLMRTDSALSLRLREIIDQHGWPDAQRLGADAVNAAFLVVQHSPFPEFLIEVLPHVERDVRAGVLDAQSYALMFDRVRVQSGHPQRYGTQYSLVNGAMVQDPVEDPARLDARRAELGLMPIAEYERLLSEYYSVEVSGGDRSP
ncbi:MAG TPA: DUF6624 domain-containing protein [Longimicrobiales bacterium]